MIMESNSNTTIPTESQLGNDAKVAGSSFSGLNLKAKDIMSTTIRKARPDWFINQLAKLFAENSISGAPVEDEDGNVLGVVSATDIVRYSRGGDRDEKKGYSDKDLQIMAFGSRIHVKVHEIMSSSVIEVVEETAVQKVAATMIDQEVHRVFVTRDEKIVGVISTVDLLKVIKDL